MRLRRPLPAVQGDTLHIVGVGDNRIGKVHSMELQHEKPEPTVPGRRISTECAHEQTRASAMEPGCFC